MILQQQKPIEIWGWAEKGEEIAVTFAEQQAATVAGEDGRWTVTLTPMPASTNPKEHDSLWYITFAEHKDDLPSDWCAQEFDSTGWCRTTIPCVWPNEHWAVLRTAFEAPGDTRGSYGKLRFSVQGKWCRNTKVYLNGTEIVQCLQLVRGFRSITLNDRAMRLLKPGRNQLVILSLGGSRWTGLLVDHFDVKLEAAR